MMMNNDVKLVWHVQVITDNVLVLWLDIVSYGWFLMMVNDGETNNKPAPSHHHR